MTTINDDFSGTLDSWTAMRGTWVITDPADTLSITALHATDGDAGITHETALAQTVNQWAEVKLVDGPTAAGIRMGPFLRCSAVSSSASLLWLHYDFDNKWLMTADIAAGAFHNDITAACSEYSVDVGGGPLDEGDYLGIEVFGTDALCQVRFYDNGTSSKARGSWGTPIFKSPSFNTTLTAGLYTGLWYGDGGGRITPAGEWDDYKAGDIISGSLDTNLRFTGTANPLTQSYTVGATATLLVLGIVTAGDTERAGGAPTFNGVTMTQADSTRKYATTPETSCELWYLLDPATGAHDISIPNTNGATLQVQASSYIPYSGYEFTYDTATGGTGTSANPSMSITPGDTNAILIGVLGHGNDAVPTLQTGVQLNRTDNGTYSDSNQYYIVTQTGAQALGWTRAGTTDNWCMCGVAFTLTEAGGGASTGTGALAAASAALSGAGNVFAFPAYGYATPDAGEIAQSWTTWNLGAGAVVTGDADYGTLVIPPTVTCSSPVVDTGDANSKEITLSSKYGTNLGSYTRYIRGSDTVFLWDAGSPSWAEYTAPVTQAWRYVQVLLTGG